MVRRIRVQTETTRMSAIDPMSTNAIRERIASRIAMLDDTQHTVVFKFVRTCSEKFTKNKNGVFIDLSTLDHKELVELLEKIDSIMETTYFDSEDTDFVDECADSICDITEPTNTNVLEYACGDTFDSPFVENDECAALAKRFETINTNLAKKCMNNKFALVKKKYNKQSATDYGMRRTDDPHLSELREEAYIIRA